MNQLLIILMMMFPADTEIIKVREGHYRIVKTGAVAGSYRRVEKKRPPRKPRKLTAEERRWQAYRRRYEKNRQRRIKYLRMRYNMTHPYNRIKR